MEGRNGREDCEGKFRRDWARGLHVRRMEMGLFYLGNK